MLKNYKKLLKTKSAKTAAIVMLLLMTSTILMTNLDMDVKAQASAQQPVSGSLPSGVTPSVTVATNAFLSFTPNPIGVNQQLLVNLWTIVPPGANRYDLGYAVTITKPDGNAVTIGPMNSYVADGTQWFSYTPDQVGTYTLQFTFPGTYFPAGYYIDGVCYSSLCCNTIFFNVNIPKLL